MNKNFAFSFIELSIAIVIIAFLIAGSTTGYKLIENSKVNGFIAEMQNIMRATNNFQLTYKSLPGDTNKAHYFFASQNCGGGTEDDCNGNNNYIIDNHTVEDPYQEAHNVWNHLFFAGFLPDITPADNTVYKSKILDGVTVSLRTPEYQIGAQRADRIANSIYDTYSNRGRIFEPNIAFKIDRKMDDGLASQGKVQTVNAYDDSSVSSTTCLSSGEYNFSTTTEECAIRITLDLL